MLGVILAGGQSRRMGRDKASLIWSDGHTLLEHARNVLAMAGIADIVVSGATAGGIADRRPGLGPVSAIETIVHKMAPERMLVIPVDMPFLSPALIKRLLRKPPTGKARIFFGHNLPLLLDVNTALKNTLRRRMECRAQNGLSSLRNKQQDRSITSLLAHIPHTTLKISELEKRQLYNINTADEWQAVTASFSQSHAS